MFECLFSVLISGSSRIESVLCFTLSAGMIDSSLGLLKSFIAAHMGKTREGAFLQKEGRRFFPYLPETQKQRHWYTAEFDLRDYRCVHILQHVLLSVTHFYQKHVAMVCDFSLEKLSLLPTTMPVIKTIWLAIMDPAHTRAKLWNGFLYEEKPTKLHLKHYRF